MIHLVHFVGFRDDRYWSAVRVFGPPDYVHQIWDIYAANDVAPGDTVVFASGESNRVPKALVRRADARVELAPRLPVRQAKEIAT